MPWLPVLFIIIPFSELMILLQVGASLGVWWTLGIIIVTAMVGYHLFRYQGLKTWQEVQSQLAQGEMPAESVLEGVIILLAGALMITPGLITDTIGLICLLPFSRKWVLAILKHRFKSKISAHATQFHYHSEEHFRASPFEEEGRTFDGEYSDLERQSPKIDKKN
jgi:UPF0716 protein FxsA